ncbi:plasma membrane localization protein [Dimargaris verticillata]|uniref:Plasma membrane localization protein n=1 Tax=Dimargaris verticillata TaxID=2761393 RepID=A0A9W8B580_9FUNG|nr:plasma membrane localization protein [Dimargaris verticillata]
MTASRDEPTSEDGNYSGFHMDRLPLMRRYIKHATLIENCYPYPVTPDAKPNSNELSYLVYYANSKPAKLAKVGVYLERKIQREVAKKKTAEVVVSLQIFEALLANCDQDLNYFSKPILNSLWAIFLVDNPDLFWAATKVFVQFCHKHNGSTLGIDLRLRGVYNQLVSKFSFFALGEHPSADLTAEHRFLGLRAINAIVMSEATRVTDSHRELEPVIPAILKNLTGTWPVEREKDHRRAEWKRIESLGLNHPKVTQDSINALAWITLKEVVENSNSFNSRFLISKAIGFIGLVSPQWAPTNPIVHLFLQIMASLQPQYRFVLVAELLQQLDEVDPPSLLQSLANTSTSSVGLISSTSESLTAQGKQTAARHGVLQPSTTNVRGDEEAQPLMAKVAECAPKKLCLVRLLSSLLNSHYILVGLSVLEILDILLRHLVVCVVLQDEEDRYWDARSDYSLPAATSQGLVEAPVPIPPKRNSLQPSSKKSPTRPIPGCDHPDPTSCQCHRLSLGSTVLSPPMAKSQSNVEFRSRPPIPFPRPPMANGQPSSALAANGSSEVASVLSQSSNETPNRPGHQVRLDDIIRELIAAIGGLGSHTYYADQVTDIVNHVIEELQVPEEGNFDDSGTTISMATRDRALGAHSLSGADITNPRQLGELRLVLLQTLSRVLRTNIQAGYESTTMLLSTTALSLLSPMLFLLNDPSSDVRLHFMQFAIDFLLHQNTETLRAMGSGGTNGHAPDPSSSDGTPHTSYSSDLLARTAMAPNHNRPYSVSSFTALGARSRRNSAHNILQSRRASLIDIEMRGQVHRAVFHHLQQEAVPPYDIVGAGAILSLLLQRHGAEELVLVLPLLLQIQDMTQAMLAPQEVALNTLVAVYLQHAAQLLKLNALSDYIDTIVSHRRAGTRWDTMVATCLDLHQLEEVQYHLFEVTTSRSEASTICTLPLSTGTSTPEVAPGLTPTPLGTTAGSLLLLDRSELLNALLNHRTLVREFPDLKSRLLGGESTQNGTLGADPIPRTRTRSEHTRDLSRSKIRASVNLDAMIGANGNDSHGHALLSVPSPLTSPTYLRTMTATNSLSATLRSSLDGESPSRILFSPPQVQRTDPLRPSWIGGDAGSNSMVHVENLREALYAQALHDSSEPDTESDPPAVRAHSIRSRPKPDLHRLLNSIQIGPMTADTTGAPTATATGGLLALTPDLRHPF